MENEELTQAQMDMAVIKHLSPVVQSSGWQGVIKPSLMQMRDREIVWIINNPLDPKVPEKAALVKAYQYVLNWEKNLETVSARMEEALAELKRNNTYEGIGNIYGDVPPQ